MAKIKPDTSNIHHLISQNLRDEYRVDMDDNKIRMNIHRHNALHALFGMLHTPKEQLMEIRALYEGVLGVEAKELFGALLGLDDKHFYIDGIVKNGRNRTRH